MFPQLECIAAFGSCPLPSAKDGMFTTIYIDHYNRIVPCGWNGYKRYLDRIWLAVIRMSSTKFENLKATRHWHNFPLANFDHQISKSKNPSISSPHLFHLNRVRHAL